MIEILKVLKVKIRCIHKSIEFFLTPNKFNISVFINEFHLNNVQRHFSKNLMKKILLILGQEIYVSCNVIHSKLNTANIKSLLINDVTSSIVQSSLFVFRDEETIGTMKGEIFPGA